jgi:cation diffusion facilitator CzcD-associated flavoprotein CzcO
MKLMKGIQLIVDGTPMNVGDSLSYKGLMYSNIPNLASSFGYTNASWTLKCELICIYVCRLLHYMDKHGYRQCTPRFADSALDTEPLLSFSSGYVQRALDGLPNQGKERPWKVYQNYLLDMMNLKFGSLEDGTMIFE